MDLYATGPEYRNAGAWMQFFTCPDVVIEKRREMVKKCLVAMNTKRAEDRFSWEAPTGHCHRSEMYNEMGRRFGLE